MVFLLFSAFLACSIGTLFGNTTPPQPVIPVPRPFTISELKLPRGSGSPAARFGAITGITDEGFVLMGGMLTNSDDNQVWTYNANNSVWNEIQTQVSIWDGACSVQDGDNLYIYGTGNQGTNLYLFDLQSNTLTLLNVQGAINPADGVACGIRNGTIYLFGGQCSDTISKFDTKSTDKKWVPVTVKSQDKPTPTKGASGLVFGDEFVMWGGSCTGDDNVWRFNLATSTWTPDNPLSEAPKARSGHSAAIDELALTDSFLIFGGEDHTTNLLYNDFWVYNLPNKTWTQFDPASDPKDGLPAPRYQATFVYYLGRAFIFSGATDLLHNTSIADFWQLVITKDCTERKNCNDCVNSNGCGWCSANSEGYQCIPGYYDVAYLPSDCYLNSFSTDLTTCPADAFPGWVVALIIVATILIIGVVWYFVIRCQRKSPGYEQIN